jgi:PKD repeat protein
VEAKAVEAKEFRGVVATFTDPGGPERIANYAATIDWGDGRTEAGTVKLVGDRFEVSGRHTYARHGNYRVRVTVRDQGGTPATSTGTARVVDAPLVASGIPFRATEGVAFSGVVGRFRDDNPNGVMADFKVTVDWGDGKKSTATLAPKGRGLFEIRGTHTYARAGTYTVLLQVLSNGGSSKQTTFRVTVGERRPRP